MNPELESLIEELATSEKYSHGIFGCFGHAGHVIQETRGSSKKIKKSTDTEYEDYVFSKNKQYNKEKAEGEFKARIWAERADDEFKFKLIFDDHRGDSRPGSHTDYTLLIPLSEVARIKPIIEAHPEILIKVFQKIYSGYDRSNGKLKMRSDNVYFEYNDPDQIDRLRRILRWK